MSLMNKVTSGVKSVFTQNKGDTPLKRLSVVEYVKLYKNEYNPKYEPFKAILSKNGKCLDKQLIQYSIYEGIHPMYCDIIDTNIMATIIDKKVSLVFDNDVTLSENTENQIYYNNGFKDVFKDMLIGGEALCVLDNLSSEFMDTTYKSYPTYRYFTNKNSVTIINIEDCKNLVYVYDELTYDENLDITYFKKTRTKYKEGHSMVENEETFFNETFKGKIFEIFKHERPDGDLARVLEPLLCFDLTSSQIIVETDKSATTIHADKEYELGLSMNDKTFITYDSPLNMNSKPLFQVVQPMFNGNNLWSSSAKWLSIVCLNSGLSPDVLELGNLSNVKTGVIENENEKTASTINDLKDFAYIKFNRFSRRFHSDLYIKFGVYSKKSLGERVKISKQLTASVRDKIKYERPHISDEDLDIELLSYKVENKIDFTPIEIEYYKSEYGLELKNPTDKVENIPKNEEVEPTDLEKEEENERILN